MRYVYLIVAFLCMTVAISAEVLLLQDGSVIRGKIIKMDEDNLTVLTEYGEMLIDRTKVKKTYFNDDEYTQDLKAQQQVQVQTQTVQEKIIERVVEVGKSVEHRGIESILFYENKMGADIKDVREVFINERVAVEFNKSSGLLTGYEKSRRISGVHVTKPVYYQMVFTDGGLSKMYYYVTQTRNVNEIASALTKATGIALTDNGGILSGKTSDGLRVRVYDGDNKYAKRGSVCVELTQNEEETLAPKMPGAAIEFMTGIGYRHFGEFAWWVEYPRGGMGFSPIMWGADVNAAFARGGIGLRYELGIGFLLEYGFMPYTFQLDNKLMLTFKSGGIFDHKKFVFGLGGNWQFEAGMNAWPPVTIAGPSLYIGGEVGNRGKRNFMYSIGYFMDGRFGRYTMRYKDYNDYDNDGVDYWDDYNEYVTISGPIMAIVWGIQLSWRWGGRKVFY